jgi:hypothetical protein
MSTYVNNAKIATPNVENKAAGIQNKNILKILFPNRPAAKNRPKNKITRIQNKAERMLSANPPATAPTPVAFWVLISLKIDQEPGTHSARKIAANPLRMLLK